MSTKGKLIGQGNTAEIYQWGEEQILKLYRKEMPEGFCQHEFRATKYIYDNFAIGPQAFEIIELEGRCGGIYQKIKGTTMLKVLLLQRWAFTENAKQFARIHKTIHQQADGGLPKLRERIAENINRVPMLREEEKRKLIQYLESLPDGNCLCHLDYHPDNIIYQGKEPIVLDWMTACVGNPCADVARTVVLLKYGTVSTALGIVNKTIDTFRKKLLEMYLDEYLKVSGLEQKDITCWELPIMAARLNEWIPPKEKEILLTEIRKRIS